MIKYILILLLSFPANATLNEVDKTQIFNKNLLTNGGFESGKAKWTASGGTFTTTTTSPMIGLVHATFDASSAAQTLGSNLVTIPVGMYGRNGVVSCLVTTPSGTATHTINAYDGTNFLSSVTVVSSTTPTRASANFIFPSSGSISVVLIAVAANEPSINVDDCFIGNAEAYNLGLVKPQDIFSASISSTDVVSNENVDWINGNCTNGTTGEQSCTFNPGIFTVAPNCTVSVDGVGSRFASIGAAGLTATDVQISVRTDASVSEDRDTIIVCQKSGVDALQTAYRPDVVASSWSGYHGDDCIWSRTNTAMGALTDDATCTLTERTNTNFGTVSTSGSVSPAITFTPKRAGKYRVCAYPQIQPSVSSDITVGLTGTVGGYISYEGYTIASTSYSKKAVLCGVYTAADTSAVTITVHAAVNSGTVSIREDSSGADTARSIEWEINQIDQNIPMPLLVNSVVSNNPGITRIESLTVTNTGSPTIARQTGTWVSSLTDNGVGDVTVNFTAGMWGTAPSCTCNAKGGAAQVCNFSAVDITTSAIRISTFTSTSGAASDNDFHLICVGQK